MVSLFWKTTRGFPVRDAVAACGDSVLARLYYPMRLGKCQSGSVIAARQSPKVSTIRRELVPASRFNDMAAGEDIDRI